MVMNLFNIIQRLEQITMKKDVNSEFTKLVNY